MGNSNRRASRNSNSSNNRSTSATSASFPILGESLFKKPVLSDKNLAPRNVAQNSENREAECPICFVCYEDLNIAVCCKQAICTDCYVQLKESTHRQCPFCNRESLVAEYAKHTDQTTKTCTITNTPPAVASTPGNHSNPASTASNNSNASAKVSKKDREELEAQIRNQRLEFLEDDFSESDSRSHSTELVSSHSTSRSNGRSPSATASASRSLLHNTQRNTSNSNNRFETIQRNRFASESSEDRDSLDMIQNTIAASFNQFFEIDEFNQLAGLEQLEQLMLMEAIRQSMLDSAATNSDPANEQIAKPAEHPINLVSNTEALENVGTSNSQNDTETMEDSNNFREHTNTDSCESVHHDIPSSPLRLLEEIELLLNSPPPSPLTSLLKSNEDESSKSQKTYDI